MAGRGYGQGVAVARDLSQEACARASTVGFQTSETLIGCGGNGVTRKSSFSDSLYLSSPVHHHQSPNAFTATGTLISGSFVVVDCTLDTINPSLIRFVNRKTTIASLSQENTLRNVPSLVCSILLYLPEVGIVAHTVPHVKNFSSFTTLLQFNRHQNLILSSLPPRHNRAI